MEIIGIALFIYLAYRAYYCKRQADADNWERKTGQIVYYHVFGNRTYHRASCIDVVKDHGANTVLVESPEKSISEGIFPCQKCNPPRI